jgi:uncharacterized protein (DUF58 family)
MADPIAAALVEGQQAGARYCLGGVRRPPQGTAGSQLGRLAGESMEFMDHREYQPGDDLRRLDWSAYARTDKMIVKLFRQEVSPHLDLVIDGSRSMDLEGTQKSRAAVGLGAALATAAANSGYTHRAFLTGEGCRPLAGGTQPPTVWQGLRFDSLQTPPESFRKQPPVWRPQGLRAIVSDLLWLDDPLELLLSMSDRASAVCVLHVLAESDVEPALLGNVRLVDSETEACEELFIDASALARYRNKVARHREAWHRAARQVGATFVPLVAERLVANWDFSPLVEAEILTV